MTKILVIYQSLATDDNLLKIYSNFPKEYEVIFICPKKITFWMWFWTSEYNKNVSDNYLKKYPNIKIFPIKLINEKNIFFRTLYSFKLYSIIKSLKPDIIHCYNELFSPTLSQIIFFKNIINKNIKVFNYSWENIDWSKKFPHYFFWRYAAKYIDKVITANEQAIIETKRFWVDSTKISKIYWWIDFSNFEYIKHDISWKSEFNIWFIWRLLIDKWLKNLIESISILWPNYSLTLIWDGSDKEYLINLSNNLWIGDRVKFFWRVEYAKLKEFIRDFDAFVLPSISKPYWEEQFWRVLVEMMASWVPVIGSSSWAIPEVIGDRWLVFKEGDSRDLAEKIRFLCKNPSFYGDCTERAYSYSLKNYSYKSFADNIRKAYE